MWMTYDTAVPRATFLAAADRRRSSRRSSGFSAFLALSFMAAETLTRRAFGHHPQFWRVWAKGPGSSTADPRPDGRRLPARVGVLRLRRRALPDRDARLRLVDAVRSAAASRRARDLRALALGDRQLAPGGLLGRVPVPRRAARRRRADRRSLRPARGCSRHRLRRPGGRSSARDTRRIPTQPSFARPVELILPSIGFGLLYVYFGLLPGIVLHFAFDVVWFALPIFLADAPGIWFQQLMVVVMTLVPLWVVLWRRRQAGAWTELAAGAIATRPGRRRRRPSPSRPRRSIVHHGLSPRTQDASGSASARSSIVACVVAALARDATRPACSRSAGRPRQTSRARALDARGVDARAAVARAAGAGRRERRRRTSSCPRPPATSGGGSCSACTCRSRGGTSASRRSRATWRSAPKSGASS